MSRKLALIGGVAVLVVAGGVTTAVLAVRSHQRKVASAALSKAASDFAACAVGEPFPADVGKSLEGIRLAEEAAADTMPAGTTPWPQRCVDYTDSVQASYERAYAVGATDRWVPINAIKTELQAGSTQHLKEVLEALKPFLTEKAAPSVKQPMHPMASGIALASLSPMYGRAPSATVTDVESVDGELHLTLSDAGGLASCVLDGSSFAMRCSPLVADATGLLPFAKGGRALFWRTLAGDEMDVTHIVDANGKLVYKPPSYSYGYAFADGRIGIVTNGSEDWENYQPSVVLRSAGGVVSKTSSDVALSGTPRVAGGWILWKEVDYEHPGDPAKVKTRNLAGGFSQAIGDVDRRPSGTGHSSGHCQSSTHLFVDMSPALAIHGPDGKWTSVKQEARPDDAERTLSCDGASLRILDASTSNLRVQECDASGCKSWLSTATLPEGAVVASLGKDDFLVVWAKTQGLFGLRAPLASLGTAKVFALAQSDGKGDEKTRATIGVGGVATRRSFADVGALQSVAGGVVLFTQIAGKSYALAFKASDGSVTGITGADAQ